MTELWLFILVWGVWILMPIIVDGVDTLVRLVVVLIWGRNFKEHNIPDEELPRVTVLVPAYNEEQVIDRCLNSIKIQDYPHDKLEVVVINDGSTDYTAERVMNHINGGFNGFNGNGHNGNGFNGNGFKNGANGGANGGSKNGANGGTNGYNGNGFNGRIPQGIYSTRDFRNGLNGGKNGINGGSRNGVNGGSKNGNGFNGNGYLKINGETIPVPPFSGEITLISNGHVGKPKALNLGVTHSNHSDIVITIDSDVVLAPHAIRNMAAAFAEDPKMGAATGHIEINPDILEERDEYGNLVLDEQGRLITKKLTWWENLLARCQFLEYLDAFRLGRQFQATVHSAYILAGAFSAFRRDVLEASPLYRTRTVSEDFDLTADIHRTKTHIGYIADAKALLEPITSWDPLFSQRVRWCRGQLEVCGAHQEMIGNRKYGPIGWFGFPQMLIVDHTLAFPRLIWTMLLLLFPLLGYPMFTIAMAIAFMYVLYVGLSFLQTFSAYTITDEDTKKQAEKSLAYCFVLPIYRLVTFYFRMSGYLKSLREPQAWEMGTSTKLTNGIKNGINGFKNGFKNGHNGKEKTNGFGKVANGFAAAFSNGVKPEPVPEEPIAPELSTAILIPPKEVKEKRIEEKGQEPRLLEDFIKQAYGHLEKAQFKLAEKYLAQALDLATTTAELVLIKIELAKVYLFSNQLAKGYRELSEARTLCSLLKDQSTAKEIDLLLEAIPIKKIAEKTTLETLIEQGYNYLNKRDLDKARESFGSALQVAESPEELARLKTELAKIDLALGHEKQAKAELNEALIASRGVNNELAQAIEELLRTL